MKFSSRWFIWVILICACAFLILHGVRAGDLMMIQMESSTL